MNPESPRTKPIGWLIALGVLCITLGVILGLVAIGVVAQRKQRFRINESSPPAAPAAQPDAGGTNAPR